MRAYPKPFVDDYLALVWAASNRDEDELLRRSVKPVMTSSDDVIG